MFNTTLVFHKTQGSSDICPVLQKSCLRKRYKGNNNIIIVVDNHISQVTYLHRYVSIYILLKFK